MAPIRLLSALLQSPCSLSLSPACAVLLTACSSECLLVECILLIGRVVVGAHHDRTLRTDLQVREHSSVREGRRSIRPAAASKSSRAQRDRQRGASGSTADEQTRRESTPELTCEHEQRNGGEARCHKTLRGCDALSGQCGTMVSTNTGVRCSRLLDKVCLAVCAFVDVDPV